MTNEQQAIYIRSVRCRLKDELAELNAELLKHESVPRHEGRFFIKPTYFVDCLDGLWGVINDLGEDLVTLEAK